MATTKTAILNSAPFGTGPGRPHAVSKRLLATLGMFLWMTTAGHGSVFTVHGDANDRGVRADTTLLNVGATNCRIGTETAGQTTCYVIPFLLPAIPAGEVITGASLAVYSEFQSNLNGQANMDVRGVRTATTSAVLATDSSGGTLIADNAYVLNSSIPVAQALTISTEDMVTYLRSIYAGDPDAAGKYLFLKIFPDVANTLGSRHLTVSAANHATAIQRPVLTLTSEPAAVLTEPITHNGVTWDLLGSGHTMGTFVTGDPWVVGPVTITRISNSLNAIGFTPRKGQNGSMINPLVGHNRSHQGYDDGLDSYRESLNAALPNGQPVSTSNPLAVPVGSTLISMVSWLYLSETQREPGCPSFNGGTDAPRPTTRSAGVLTVLDAPPPSGSFRPPYAGADKTVRFHTTDLDRSKLLDLAPPANTPNPTTTAASMAKTWVDHGYEYLGAMFHPSEHMPDYGRDMAQITLEAALLLHLDFSGLPGGPHKDQLLIPFIQYGIDTCGIADAGGGWPANGGHHMGRFWPVLFAGILLNDAHMRSVGTWGHHRGSSYATADAGLTEFQEFQNHFYVSPTEVTITNGASWDPDTRGDLLPYTAANVGTPEWGIRHSFRPQADNAAIDTAYRDINGACTPGFALAARIMGAQGLWNHDAYFDYADRYMALTGGAGGVNNLPLFARNMWATYASSYDVFSYNDFLLTHFTPAEIANPGITGRTADPDNDGNRNASEHYFGTLPRTPDARPKLSSRAEGPNLLVGHWTAVRPPNGRTAWECSPDLTNWYPAEPTSTTTSGGGTGPFYVESAFAFSDDPQAFYRVGLGE